MGKVLDVKVQRLAKDTEICLQCMLVGGVKQGQMTCIMLLPVHTLHQERETTADTKGYYLYPAGSERETALEEFYKQWKDDSLVMLKWIGLQVGSTVCSPLCVQASFLHIT